MDSYFLSTSYEFTCPLNSQTFKAKEVFLAINYNPKLDPFTDTWDDLVDEFGKKTSLEK